MPAGLAFREGIAGTDFEDSSPYLIHYVNGKENKPLTFDVTPNQKTIRQQLYNGKECDFSIYGKYSQSAAI